MSYLFDCMARVFEERFIPKSGDNYEKYLFKLLIQDIHSANHNLNDDINHNSCCRETINELRKYIMEKNSDVSI